ncbi:MAG: phosphatidylinositol kinase, partial [Deltaproteobacteria bacterium]
ENVLKGDLPRSSAGGEQPKFTAFNGESSSHVIVKFSPEGDSEIAERWRDILITEYYASKMINTSIVPAVESRLFEMNGRLFLETQRFDRFGEFGRSSMISLDLIDREYVGLGNHWPRVLKRLFDRGIVEEHDVPNAKALWYFGKLINNTDMHLGNLSLSMENDMFRLSPVYDMCSMGFAPRSSGDVRPYTFEVSDIQKPDINEELMETVKKAAYDFWEKVARDDRISRQFKDFLRQGNPVDSLL